MITVGSVPREEAAVEQLLLGLEKMPVPVDDSALVVSDNADIYGTVADLWDRKYQ